MKPNGMRHRGRGKSGTARSTGAVRTTTGAGLPCFGCCKIFSINAGSTPRATFIFLLRRRKKMKVALGVDPALIEKILQHPKHGSPAPVVVRTAPVDLAVPDFPRPR